MRMIFGIKSNRQLRFGRVCLSTITRFMHIRVYDAINHTCMLLSDDLAELVAMVTLSPLSIS